MTTTNPSSSERLSGISEHWSLRRLSRSVEVRSYIFIMLFVWAVTFTIVWYSDLLFFVTESQPLSLSEGLILLSGSLSIAVSLAMAAATPVVLEEYKVTERRRFYQREIEEWEHHSFHRAHMEAADPDSSPTTLARYALYEDPRIRSKVAMNPSTPLVVLQHLASDTSLEVRAALSTNPNAADLLGSAPQYA